MSAWQIIREHFTKGTRPGSTGELRALNNAADLFLALLHAQQLTPSEAAEFNADKQLTEALILRGKLKELDQCV